MADSGAAEDNLGLFIFKRKKDLAAREGFSQKISNLRTQNSVLPDQNSSVENLTQTNREFNSIFNSSKNKSRIANHLCSIVIKDLTMISDAITEEKYLQILSEFMQQAFQHKDFAILADVCDHLLKLGNRFSANVVFQNDLYHFGFITNFKIATFEKCFVFFRKIAKGMIELAQLKHEAETKGQEVEAVSDKIHYLLQRYSEF